MSFEQRSGQSTSHDDVQRSPSGGKRTRTASLPVQRKGAPAPAASERPPTAAAPPAVDDPFALHLVQRAGAGTGDAAEVHAAAAHGTSGAGGALPFLDQIQASFGHHDVGHVQAHTDQAAGDGARAMGAQAYAVGDRVAFAGAPDLHTAAHEAAHVVQQRAGVHLKGGVGEDGDAYERHADQVADLVVQGKSAAGVLDQFTGGGAGTAVQRKILIAGAAYDPTPDLPDVKSRYGADMVELLTRMHNGGKPPDHSYPTKERLMQEVNLRDEATLGMEKANSNGANLRYTNGTTDPSDGHLDPTFWKKEGFYQFVLKPGAKPADAVRSIFENKDNVLECNSTMVAIEYRAMLQTMGDDAFNKRFMGGGLVISPHHAPPTSVGTHPLHEQKMIETVTITSSADLLPGDWIYFKNFPDYIAKHPGGFWTGEHTMYLGDGKFQGFGTAVSTEGEILQKLLDAYNTGLPTAEQKKLEDLPGLQNYARRPVAENIIK